MKKQLIITVGREFGSAGHFIAQMLSERLGIALYDKKLLEGTVISSGYSREILEKYDEKPVNPFISRRIGNYTNSIEENVAEKIFEFIRTKADEGESFIVVGRCGEYVLRDNPNMMSIFILGDMDEKVKRIMSVRELSENKARDLIKKKDKRRKMYHNYYSDIKWGDSRGYDLCVNSSTLGIEKTVDVLMDYINKFKEE